MLNQDPYAGAQILLARENFGCGSSREHAVWALMDFGIRVVIAPSFADIFYNNSFKNGLLPIALMPTEVDAPVRRARRPVTATSANRSRGAAAGATPDGRELGFEIDEFRKHCLLNGLDDIGLTMQHADAIRAFEEDRTTGIRERTQPWLK